MDFLLVQFYFTMSLKKPIINDDEYFTIKNKLIELVEKNDWLISLNEYNVPNTYLDIVDAEQYADQELLNDLKSVKILNCMTEFEYTGIPKDKSEIIIVNNRRVYKRDRQISLNALARANFSCEINEEHPLFMRRNSDVAYTEPHHLIPMAYSDKFESSLDVEENIVSLCSNCHNQLHYGKGFEFLLENLYNKRKEYLLSVNIDISLKELINMYR